jgi:hypothetical protein
VVEEYGYGIPITRVNMNKGNEICDITEDCADKVSKPVLSGWAVRLLHSKGKFTHTLPCPCFGPVVPCRANSHMPFWAHAMLQQCCVLCESHVVAGKIQTACPTV